MALKVMSNFAFYASHIFKGLFGIAVRTEEFIFDWFKVYEFFELNEFTSSQFTIEKLLSSIDFDNAKVIVEYGAGIGNISIEILRRMRKNAKLLMFEIKEDLIASFKNEYDE